MSVCQKWKMQPSVSSKFSLTAGASLTEQPWWTNLWQNCTSQNDRQMCLFELLAVDVQFIVRTGDAFDALHKFLKSSERPQRPPSFSAIRSQPPEQF